MLFVREIFLLFLLFFTSESLVREEAEVEIDEEFTEALLLRPLPDRKVLAHFHFQSKVPPTHLYGRHHHLFPKSIYQLVKGYIFFIIIVYIYLLYITFWHVLSLRLLLKVLGLLVLLKFKLVIVTGTCRQFEPVSILG